MEYETTFSIGYKESDSLIKRGKRSKSRRIRRTAHTIQLLIARDVRNVQLIKRSCSTSVPVSRES